MVNVMFSVLYHNLKKKKKQPWVVYFPTWRTKPRGAPKRRGEAGWTSRPGHDCGKSHGRQDVLDPGQRRSRLGMGWGPGVHRLLDICDLAFSSANHWRISAGERVAQVPLDRGLGYQQESWVPTKRFFRRRKQEKKHKWNTEPKIC